jgi:hypothetical protein
VTRSGSAGRRRAAAYLLALATAVLSLGVQTPSAAAAVDLQLTFTMTSLKTSGYDPDDRVTLEGTVTNTGSAPAYGVQVILWRSRDPIQSLATLRQANTNTILGSRLPISADHYVVVSTSTQAFAPGQAEVVTLRATMAELGFDTRGAAFALGADLIASATADNATDYPTVGQLRTFLPVPGKKKVPVTSIVQLSAAPTKLVDNLFRNDSLAAELTGRLSSLLYTAAQPGMSWLIDPALLDAVRDMADGYEVSGKDGNTPGSGQDAARAWLERFGRLDHDTGARTLFANPDLDGARVAGDTLVVSRSERAAAGVDGLDGLPLVVVPAGDILTSASFDFLSGSGADLVVATNTVAAGALQAGAGDRPLVLGAYQAVPATAETPANLGRQLALATAAVAGARGEVRLLDSIADVEQDASAMTDWMVRRDLAALQDTSPSVHRVALVATKPARLSADQFDRLHRLESDFTAHAELAPESSLTEQSDAAVSRAAASAWVDDATGFDSQLTGVAGLVALPEVGRSVFLDASPRFVMSSRANQFPVTVTNDLTEPVQVKVVVTTDNPQRLTVPPSELITVPPNQGVTVNIRLEATSNGVVAARAYLATQSGHRVSPDTPITVEVTDIGIVAWIIVGVSGLVLVGATAWRIRQVRRRTGPPPTREITE